MDSTRLRQWIQLTLLAAAVSACGGHRSDEAGDAPGPASSTSASASPATDAPTGNRPNILLIVADDMGYSDIGAFGSEISTPAIDQLAADGLVMTQFKVGPTCSPTRAMLYSGTDNHRNGLGTMGGMESDAQRGRPGYETYLNDRVVTYMKLLQDAGYHTYLAGKWQQGNEPGFLPLDRGFERAWWLMRGAANHFADPTHIFRPGDTTYYWEDGEAGQAFPADFYSANTVADKLIEYIDDGKDDGRPFYAMASFRTPHWPIQAPDADIEKYRGAYDDGYDAIRARRIERMRERGLLHAGQEPAPLHPAYTPWQELSEDMQQREARRMEVYAAMVDVMDQNVGRLVEHLKQEGMYENTLILFFSDNGAEGNDPGVLVDDGNIRFDGFDNSLENIGRPGSWEIQGPGWAWVSNTPFNLHKGFATEGGISTPFIAAHASLIPGGRISDSFATVLDVLPTLLELTDVDHPGTEYEGRTVLPPIGTSMVPLFEGAADTVHPDDYVYAGELWGRRIVRRGDWKMSRMAEPWGSGDWALFDLANDIAEQHDLSAENPERVAEMSALYEAYTEANDVLEDPDLLLRYSNENDYLITQ